MSTVGSVSIKDARRGEVVTTIDQRGGVGRGYLLAGEVWVSSGSYWAVNAKADVIPMKRFIRDGGAGYRKAATKILGGS